MTVRQYGARAYYVLLGAALVYLCLPLGFLAWGVPLVAIWRLATLYRWALPYLQSLRSRQLHVYLGPLRELESPDLVQGYFRNESSFQNHLGLMVEILALGNGDRIWRFEGVDADEQLAHVRSVRVAVIPDVAEAAARPLTPGETAELKGHIRAFRLGGVSVLVAAAISSLFVSMVNWCAAIWCFSEGIHYGLIGSLFLADLGFVCFLLRALKDRTSFARTLAKDLKVGKVSGGELHSGTPWVMNGLPAPWRLGAWGDASTMLKVISRVRKRLRRSG